MELGSLVWFDPGPDISYALPGRVRESFGSGLRIECPIDGKTYDIADPQNNVRVRHDNIEAQDIDDMIQLRDLHEGSVLFNLQTRYRKDLIYTYTGSILVAVNPYRLFNIYGLDTVKQYERQRIGHRPPHLFAIGAGAYSRMMETSKNQCIIISGESGAGKTESTKLIMQYLAAVNKDHANMITEQILEANPLLESFGNAKTIKNDNSSRFGKYSEVFYNKEGAICGAKTTDYLLEKSRIVRQAPGERNYHVFYEMLAGMSPAEKAKLGLYDAERYHYLNQGSRSSKIDGKPDAEDFFSLGTAFDVLNFKPQEQETIYGILASILHLGNVAFQPAQFGNSEGLVVQNQPTIKFAAKFLQLQPEHLERAITFRIIEARGESTLIPRSYEQAMQARDGMAKSLYSTLFAWLVQRINSIVTGRIDSASHNSIAILDIFGFEVFEVNSFEQICINFANEHLQYFFNKHIFQLEQREYAQERIDWKDISYVDNQQCLDLISKRPIGVLHILDDESAFPKGTDQTFLDKCHYQHVSNPYYEKPKMAVMEFGIKHYAGKVYYNADNFLAKNKDTLKKDVMDMFINSRSRIISDMFRTFQKQEDERAMMGGSSRGRFVSPLRKIRASTVATRFQESLQDLIETMSRCNPYFVRCVKPNENKAPMQFDSGLVLKQLRYSGMLETIRIRKAGYPIRLTYMAFVNRYRFMVEWSRLAVDSSYQDVSIHILQKAYYLYMQSGAGSQAERGEAATLYKVGTSKIFIKEVFESYLEFHRSKILYWAVVVLQKWTRGLLARKNYHRERMAILTLQSCTRAWIARTRYHKIRNGVMRLQAVYKGNRDRHRFKKLLALSRQRQKEEFRKQRERDALRAPTSASSGVSISHLDIPYELYTILEKSIEWSPPHSERMITKVIGQVALEDYTFSFPHDIDSNPFSKYVNIYFKRAYFGAMTHPIQTGFHRLNDSEEQEAVAIFKLITRFMMEESPSKDHEFVLGNYIAQKGINSRGLRDEIFSQICNQTWNNPSSLANEKAWILMTNLLGAFPPSKKLYKCLLKYISDHAYNGYKSFCQHKLLRMDSHALTSELSRTYPPCLQEWKANRLRANMALELKSPDGEEVKVQLDSWTTGEDFAMTALKRKGITKGCHGWSVYLQDENYRYELPGFDYVLDLIAEMELPPDMPVQESSFLVSSELVQERLPKHRKTTKIVHKTITEIENPQPPATPEYTAEWNVERPGKGHRYIQMKTSEQRPDLHIYDDPPIENEGGYFRENSAGYIMPDAGYILPDADYNAHDVHRPSLSTPRYINARPAQPPQPDYPGAQYVNTRDKLDAKNVADRKSIGGIIRSIPIPESQSEEGLEDFVESVFNPVLSMNHSTDDLSDPAYINQALKGGGKGPRPPSPILGRTDFSANKRRIASRLFQDGSMVDDDDDDNDSIGPELHVTPPSPQTPSSSPTLPTKEPPQTKRKPSRPTNTPPPTNPPPSNNPPDITTSSTEPPPPIITNRPPRNIRHITPPSTYSKRNPSYLSQPSLNKGSSYNQSQPNTTGMTNGIAGGTGMGVGANILDPNLMAPPLLSPAYTNPATPGFNFQAPMMMPAQPMLMPQQVLAMQQQQQQQLLVQQVAVNQQQMLAQQKKLQEQQDMLIKMQQQQQQPTQKPAMETSAPPPTRQQSSRHKAAAVFTNQNDQPQMHRIPRKSSMRMPSSGSSSGESSANTTPASKKRVSIHDSVVTIPGDGETETTRQVHPHSPSPIENGATPIENGAIPPAAPPPPPVEPMLIAKSGKMIVIDDDVRNRARTVRVAEVVWPPRRNVEWREDPEIDRNIGDAARGAKQTTSIHKVSVDELQNKAKNLKPVIKSKARPRIKSAPEVKIPANNKQLLSERLAAINAQRRPEYEKPTNVHKQALEKIRLAQTIMKEEEGSPRSPPPRISPPSSPQTSPPPPPPPPQEVPSPVAAPPPPGPSLPPPPQPPPVEPSTHGQTDIIETAHAREAREAVQAQSHSEAISILRSRGINLKSNAPIMPHHDIPITRRVSIQHSNRPQPPVEMPLPMPQPLPQGMSQRDIRELEEAMTKMYPSNKEAFYTYNRVKWSLNLRKEVFTPGEKLDNPSAQHLIFCQIVKDTFRNSCIRMRKEEKRNMQQMLGALNISEETIASNIQINNTVKRQVIEAARKLPLYFTRLFPVSGGRKNPQVQMLGVSHAGVFLIKREMEPERDQLHIIEAFMFSEITEVKVTSSGIIRLFLASDTIIPLYTVRAAQIKSMIEAYIIDLQRDSEHVRAVQDYVTNESTLLSFHKGDVIKLNPRQQVIDSDWLYGMLDGKAGHFPRELVEPVAGAEGARLFWGKRETTSQQPIRPDVIHERSTHQPPQRQTSIPEPVSQEELDKFSMVEFAMKNFRPSHHKYVKQHKNGSISGSIKFLGPSSRSRKGSKSKKVSDTPMTRQEYEALVEYSNSPIQVSLIDLTNSSLNKVALQCFIALMQIMGDYPLRSKANVTREDIIYECVCTIIKTCLDHPVLIDEVYCHVIKQITNNTSTKSSSCVQGWRIFYLISAIFKCTDKLKPYLKQYLTTTTQVKQPHFANIAMLCVQNLRQTFRFGGRKALPGKDEVTQIMLGRFVRRHPFMLPGNILVNLKVTASSVVAGAVEDICNELGISQPGAATEFGLFVFIKSVIRGLQPTSYIMDVTTHYDKQNEDFVLVCKKVAWFLPIKLDNERYVQVMYNQIKPDFLSGSMVALDNPELTDSQIQEFAKLASVQLRANDHVQIPTMRDLPSILPASVLEKFELSQWLNWIHEQRPIYGHMSSHEAKAEFVSELLQWPLFGSTFFKIKSTLGTNIRGECVVAINKNGVHFIQPPVLRQSIVFREVISTRRLKSKSKFYLEMKCGNLMKQRIVRMESEQGEEISTLISLYIRALPGPHRTEDTSPSNQQPSDPSHQSEDPPRRQSHLSESQDYQPPGAYINPEEASDFPRNPRPSIEGMRAGHRPSVVPSDGGSSYDDQFKIHLPPDENGKIVDGKRTYSRQRYELAQQQVRQTSEQRQQREQIQRQLTKKFDSRQPQLHPHRDYQSDLSNGHVSDGRNAENAGVQRRKTRGNQDGGGDILRRGLNRNKPRPISLQPTRNDPDFKISLPPAEYQMV